MEHEEKFPIRFSLSQFVLLLGVEVVLLVLVFLLGARSGNFIFPERYTPHTAISGLEPTVPPAKRSDRLADAENDEMEGTANDEEALPQEGEEENIQVNKSLDHLASDKNMMVRFKSSGYSKFSIEVGQYFDEALAARQITKLKEQGYEAFMVIDQVEGGDPQFAVRIGSFGEHQIAEKFAAKMSNETGLELRVVQVN
jgi:hypothetical protein